MKRTKWMFICLLAIAIAVVAFFSYRWLQPDLLSREAAETFVLERYDTNEIETLSYNNNAQTYELTFQRGAGHYGITIDAKSGAIQALTLIDMQEEPLEEEEAKAVLIDSYENETLAFTSTDLQDGQYQFEFTINGRSGTAVIDAATGTILSNTLEEETVLLTPEQAAEIALAAVPGTVDDIDQETQNDRLVYEVDIEDTGRDDDALIIIDAYTGEVLSVIWD